MKTGWLRAIAGAAVTATTTGTAQPACSTARRLIPLEATPERGALEPWFRLVPIAGPTPFHARSTTSVPPGLLLPHDSGNISRLVYQGPRESPLHLTLCPKMPTGGAKIHDQCARPVEGV